MTTERRPFGLVTPRIESRYASVGDTTEAPDGNALAHLANDCCTGHPAQRWTLARSQAGTYHFFYQPTRGPRFAVIRVLVTAAAAMVPFDRLTLDLAVTDGTTALTSADANVPRGLKADTYLTSASPGLTGVRFSLGGQYEYTLDLAALRTAGLSATVPWRFTLTIAVTGNVYAECVQFEEIPRFSVDDAEAFGVLTNTALPRQYVRDDDQLLRLATSIETAYDYSLRTYHALAIDEGGTVLTTSAAAWAALTNDEEAAGVPTVYAMRGRRLKTAAANGARFYWRVRYRTGVALVAPAKAHIRVNTGGGASPYVIDLGPTAGAWADSDLGTGYLSTLAADGWDAMTFEAYVDGGVAALDVCARGAWERPE